MTRSMLDTYLDLTIDAIILAYSCRMEIRGVLKPHATLANWYMLAPLGQSAYLTFEVESFEWKGSSLDGKNKVEITLARS